MTGLSVLICDDEQLALDRLHDMLGGCPDVTVVGMTQDGRTALDQIASLRPQLAFLDIEMPGLDGFDIVQHLSHQTGGQEAPLIVFVTAHPQFAPMAFDSGAIDFLSKPVRLNRLETCISRARTAVSDRAASARLAELQSSLDALRKKRDESAENDHIWIRRRSEVVRLGFGDIDYIRAEGEYIRLFAGNTSYLHRDSISAIASRLDGFHFIRVHRSVVVRTDIVVAIRRKLQGSIVLRIRDGQELPVGRKYAKAVRSQFNPQFPSGNDGTEMEEKNDESEADQRS